MSTRDNRVERLELEAAARKPPAGSRHPVDCPGRRDD